MPANDTRPVEIVEIPVVDDLGALVQVLNERFRDLGIQMRGLVSNPARADVDLGTKRIANLADPSQDLDAVNLRTLKRLKPGTTVQNITEGGATVTPRTYFAVIFTKDGFVADGEYTPYYTVFDERKATPIAVVLSASVAPPAAPLKVNWRVTKPGELAGDLLTLPLELAVGESGPLFQRTLALTEELPEGTTIDMLVIAGGDAEKVTGQILFRR